VFWFICLWHRCDPYGNTEQRLHFYGMERRGLQRYWHVFNHGYFEHVGYRDVHALTGRARSMR
jgi:hypothetical protein